MILSLDPSSPMENFSQPQPQPQPPDADGHVNNDNNSPHGNNNDVGVAKNGEVRVKRDEWSEGAVSSLLEAYEEKWTLRNRAKLKGNDWEDVARHVSSRSNCTRSVKTQTQCKNKIESMKKRYRAEAANNNSSSWPLFSRLDSLLRCKTPNSSPPPPLPELRQEDIHQVAQRAVDDCNSPDGDDRGVGEGYVAVKEDKCRGSPPHMTTMIAEEDGAPRSPKRRRCSEGREVAESIKCLAEAISRVEEAKINMIKDFERVRAETEMRRGEMELKRTEILAQTQLQIAKLISGKSTSCGLNATSIHESMSLLDVLNWDERNMLLKESPDDFGPHIIEVKNICDDGNCDFHAVALGLGVNPNTDWVRIRKDLMEEVIFHYEFYCTIFYRDVIDAYRRSLYYYTSPCSTNYWMSMPHMGYMVASFYNVVLVLISKWMCLILFPLRGSPTVGRLHMVASIRFIHESHFIHIKLSHWSPIPLVASY